MKSRKPGRHLRTISAATAIVTGAFVWSSAATAATDSKSASFNLVTPGTLTVANFGTEYPEVIVNGNKITGIDGDLLNAFAKQNGLKVKLFTTSFPSTILAVQQHKADVAVNFYYSPARGQTVKYGGPYFADHTVVIVNKKAIPKYTGPSSLSGKKMGTIVGTVYEPLAQAAFPSGNVTVYPSVPTAGTALINGQIDAMVDSSSTFTAPPLEGNKSVAAYPVKTGQFGITAANITFPDSNIVGCNQNALNSALNAQLKSMQKSGQWDKILKKYGEPTPYKTYKTPTGGCNK